MKGGYSDLEVRFSAYSDEVENIRQSIAAANPTPEHRSLQAVPGYVTSGSEFDVVRLCSDDTLVVKLPYVSHERGNSLGETLLLHTEAYSRGLGQVGLEQMVAYNKQVPAILCYFDPGEVFNDIRDGTKARIPLSRYVELLETFEAMQEKELKVDMGEGNLMFGSTKGFTVLDYEVGEQPLEKKIMYVARMLFEQAQFTKVPKYALQVRDLYADMLDPRVADSINRMWTKKHFQVDN